MAPYNRREVNPFRADAKDVSRVRPIRMSGIEERFVLEYLIDLNATQAFIRAGGNPVEAQRISTRLLKSGTLCYIAIERAKAERAARTKINADNVMEELGRIVRGDPRALFTPDGGLKKPHEYTRDDAAMLESVKTRRIVEADANGKMHTVEVMEVKLTPKLPAIEKAMKHLGLLNDKLDISITSVGQRLDEAVARTGRSIPNTISEDDDDDIIDIDDEGNAIEREREPRDQTLDDLLA